MTVAETLSETKDDFIEYIFYIYNIKTESDTDNTKTD